MMLYSMIGTFSNCIDNAEMSAVTIMKASMPIGMATVFLCVNDFAMEIQKNIII